MQWHINSVFSISFVAHTHARTHHFRINIVNYTLSLWTLNYCELEFCKLQKIKFAIVIIKYTTFEMFVCVCINFQMPCMLHVFTTTNVMAFLSFKEYFNFWEHIGGFFWDEMTTQPSREGKALDNFMLTNTNYVDVFRVYSIGFYY